QELKDTQSQLIQSQKMESVGRLAGGIAHDFNNMLTAILGYTYAGMKDSSSGDQQHIYFEEIWKAAERASNLTQQLLAFSRRQIIETEVLDLNHMVLDVGKMLERLIGEHIELEILPDPKAGSVKAEPGQLEQVLVNLAVNARDAMPEGGCLLIETSTVTLDESFTDRHNEVIPGKYVLLSVSDTGTGMSDEISSHIFEPFFTTKEVGKGTGLGLSTCYGIVKQSAGYLTVYSEPGRGTTFKVYLPRVTDDVSQPDPPAVEPDQLPRGEETVLLAEDEPAVRELASMMLRRQGYKVLEAANGVEALELAEDRASDRIDLLLTDVVMPHMGGRELAEQMQAIHPETRVLYTSGYTDEAIVHQGIEGQGVQFIQKPFSSPDLARKVREVLDLRRRLIGPLGLPIDIDLPLPESYRGQERTLI
ncbi:MAG: response regulator, partial [Dehalococcoidia bacterium]